MKHLQEKGKFIVIEGIDGSGKTRQTSMLESKMDSLGILTYFTMECSRGPIGMVIRNDYLSGERKSDPRITNLLYAIDRLDHITNEDDGMLRFINDGLNVVSDRYYLSSIAYYSSEFFGTPEYENQMKFILDQNQMNRELLIPDLTIVLTIDPKDAMERISRGRKGHVEIYESIDKLTKISQCYDDGIKLLRGLGENIVTIDGNGTDLEVFDKVWKVVEPLVK
ncbi:MAG: dTMP kinase [Ruminococcus flavefaciens]|nr:dTMP kinase [Ruminococcus flavefaciens]